MPPRDHPTSLGTTAPTAHATASGCSSAPFAAPEAHGNYYSYHIRALGDVYNFSWIECCNALLRDHESIPDFTDAAPEQQVSCVKAVYMTELQNVISMLNTF